MTRWALSAMSFVFGCSAETKGAEEASCCFLGAYLQGGCDEECRHKPFANPRMARGGGPPLVVHHWSTTGVMRVLHVPKKNVLLHGLAIAPAKVLGQPSALKSAAHVTNSETSEKDVRLVGPESSLVM